MLGGHARGAGASHAVECPPHLKPELFQLWFVSFCTLGVLHPSQVAALMVAVNGLGGHHTRHYLPSSVSSCLQ